MGLPTSRCPAGPAAPSTSGIAASKARASPATAATVSSGSAPTSWYTGTATLPSSIIGAEFAEPILLLIRDPEGRWLFDDGLGHDPVVTITAPRAGDYAVYMGSHGTAAFTKPGTLIISETRP